MSIRVLDPQLASQIAAGEVIERPASVVKELVENSLDASARDITVEVQNGGLTSIRVSDDGCGMPAGEVQLAFQRHATSKLAVLSDLQEIRSLGFRGEALPSIAAVADVEVVSAERDSHHGTCLTLRSGAVASSRPQARSPGTTVTALRLFQSTPARLKFMRSPRAESARITYCVSQFALAFPEVRFTLIVDGRNTLGTTGTGSLRDAAAHVHGADVARHLLQLGSSRTAVEPVEVSGLVSPPHLSRSNRSYISLFVNRRWVHDRTLARAIDEAYQGLLMAGRYPIVILDLRVPPAEVDVNVHPTKHEVRFRYEGIVFSMTERTVKAALGTAGIPALPAQRWPAHQQSHHEDVSPLFAGPLAPGAVAGPIGTSPDATTVPGTDELRVLGQVDNTFIVAEGPEGLYLVDQHAAHERILFDRIDRQKSAGSVEVQGLLDPVVVELTPEECEVLHARKTDIEALGFVLEPFGERSYLARTVPACLGAAEAGDALREMAAPWDAGPRGDWGHRAVASIACHGAVKAGQRLQQREAGELLRQLRDTSSPRTCPHGRPTMIHLSSGELRRHFGRT